ncbi:alginate lyase family protein [Kitasatospora sp. NPDC001540]|uniref:alginate lyase family protein n=1 Tax=Kitasatospora sp. NPDC001540 TaxID=3364014 RepID=UPI0036C8004F
MNGGVEPQKSAWSQLLASSYASPSYTPHPRSTVECGPSSNPDYGCSDEREDAIAAYTDALAWYVTGNSGYAKKAIQIMDAWSGTVTAHTNSNAPLQTGWAGTVWSEAAEIVKYTYGGGWSNSSRFDAMLRNVYLPIVVQGAPDKNGNWELIMMDAAVGISVHLDDAASYNKAMSVFTGRVPAYVYTTSDGSRPAYPPRSDVDTTSELINYWFGQSTFVDGIAQETCRDFGHTGWGVEAIAHVAETARLQGTDLWSQLAPRMRATYEFHTGYDDGAAVPSSICGGSVNLGFGPVTEIAYSALHDRLGLSLASTRKYTLAHRPEGTDDHWIAWETLTHGDTGTPAATADFSVAVTPNYGSAKAGSAVSTAVSTAVVSGAAQSVALSASGLPSGASASFSPASVASGSGSTLTITTGASTPAGTYAVTVKGTAAGGTHTATYTLTVTAPSGGACHPAWSSATAYAPNDQVSYGGHNYTALYWSTGVTPGSPVAWNIWQDDGTC